MQKFYNITSRFSKTIIGIFFTICLIGMLGIRSIYQWNDSPSFSMNSPLDYGFLFLHAGLLLLLWKNRIWLEQRLNRIGITVVFFIAGVLFVCLVPLRPFSDMDVIYQASLKIADGDFHAVYQDIYFNTYPNNIFITYLFGFLFLIFPKTVLTIKILNILLTIGIAHLTVRLTESRIPLRTPKLCYLGILSFGSVFLYCNHVYTDTLFTLCSLAAVFLYLKNSRTLAVSVCILSISYFIRPVAAIYLIALLILELFKDKTPFKQKAKRCLSILLIFIGIYSVCQGHINQQFIQKEHRIPAASYVYMGFNEEEFGFQDNHHDPNLTFSDIKERMRSYSPSQLLKLLCKKAFWTWTEGTYQAERYAFGNAVEQETEKFQYSTCLTAHLKNPEQNLYLYLESFMREQYFCLACFALLGAYRMRKNREWDILYLLFIGFFLFYLFWEIKSRYLISLYPFLFVFAAVAWEYKSTANTMNRSLPYSDTLSIH